MRLVLLARRGSPVVHFGGDRGGAAASLCGGVSITVAGARASVGDLWWFGTPTQAADARILDRRRLCLSCVRVFDDWALEIDHALARQEERGHP